jgi:hypothetical protein
MKVSTPCSWCRSGTAGPDGDGEGANQSPSPSGSPSKSAKDRMDTSFPPINSSGPIGPPPMRAAPPTGRSRRTSSSPTRPGSRSYRRQNGLTTTMRWQSWSPNVSRSPGTGSRPSGCCRSLGLRATRVPGATSGAWSPMRNRCVAVRITRFVGQRCGRRVSMWSSTGLRQLGGDCLRRRGGRVGGRTLRRG